MDKALAPGAGDSRFESWAGHFVDGVRKCADEIMESIIRGSYELSKLGMLLMFRESLHTVKRRCLSFSVDS